MKTNPLNELQIQTLTHQGCTAEQWGMVFIAPGCDLSRVRNSHFRGEVHLGPNSGSIALHGLKLPCGVYEATLSDCTVGENVRIASVRTGIARYRIASDVLIEDIGIMASEPGSQFGNGIELDTVNEGGGRATIMFNRLTAQIAYMNAMFRHNPSFVRNLRALAEAEVRNTLPERGEVGRGARVLGCERILNVRVGEFAHVEGPLLLENGTINSAEEHPTIVGSGVHARDFILAEGARLDSSAMIERVFVGQGVKMGKQYSAENSLFFANCEAFHGEGMSIFAGPYTVTHHKSTLMIAGLFSFYNAGSGTNQSNHMYKLGPVHQGIFERGCKTGSSSYVLLESHIGPFSDVIGKHTTHLQTPSLPFSLVMEKGGVSSITPGWSLSSVGIVRDEEKWPKRDNRKAKEKRDLIVFDVFSPYTVEKMRNGRDQLLTLHETTPNNQASVVVGGAHLDRQRLQEAANKYQSAIVRYLYGKVLSRLGEHLSTRTPWKTAVASLAPQAAVSRALEWTDLCGLLAPIELVRGLEQQIAGGVYKTYDEVLAELKRLHAAYHIYEWQYCVEAFEKETGIRLEQLTRDRALRIVREWETAALLLLFHILEDAKKEFGPRFRIGYGPDRTEAERNADFSSVRGTMEDNTVIQKLAKEEEEIRRHCADLRTLIESTA
jgi:hypothetical protein